MVSSTQINSRIPRILFKAIMADKHLIHVYSGALGAASAYHGPSSSASTSSSSSSATKAGKNSKDSRGKSQQADSSTKQPPSTKLGKMLSEIEVHSQETGSSWYKLPKLLYLIVELVDAEPSSARSLASAVSSGRLQQLLAGKVISLEPTSLIYFHISGDHVLKYKVVNYGIDQTGSQITRAVVCKTTQVILPSDPQCGFRTFGSTFGSDIACNQSISVDDVLQTQDQFLLSSCLNVVGRAVSTCQTACSSSVITPSGSLLLTGESGSGLTTIVHVIAHQLGLPLVSVSTQSLFCVTGVGHDQLVQRAFNCATAIQQPCILLLDDLDCLCASHTVVVEDSGVTSTLLSEVVDLELYYPTFLLHSL
jgi:hypothetical protein